MTQTNANELDVLLEGIEPAGQIASALLESLADDEQGDGGSDGISHDEKVVTFGNEESDAPEVVLDRKAIYEAQGSKLTVADENEAAQVSQEGTTTPKGKKRAKKAAATKAKGKSKDASSLVPPAPKVNSFTSKSEAFAAKASMSAITDMGVGEDTIKKALDEAPLKVREKAYNVLRFAAGREALSNYTTAALCWLAESTTGLTTVNLVEKYKAGDPALGIKAYNDGTARSQAQQMSRLFGILGIVNVSGKTMTLDESHGLVKALLPRLPKHA